MFRHLAPSAAQKPSSYSFLITLKPSTEMSRWVDSAVGTEKNSRDSAIKRIYAEQLKTGPRITLLEIGESKEMDAIYENQTRFAKLQSDVQKLLADHCLAINTDNFDINKVCKFGRKKNILVLTLSQESDSLDNFHHELKKMLEKNHHLQINLEFPFIPAISIGYCIDEISDTVINDLNQQLKDYKDSWLGTGALPLTACELNLSRREGLGHKAPTSVIACFSLQDKWELEFENLETAEEKLEPETTSAQEIMALLELRSYTPSWRPHYAPAAMGEITYAFLFQCGPNAFLKQWAKENITAPAIPINGDEGMHITLMNTGHSLHQVYCNTEKFQQLTADCNTLISKYSFTRLKVNDAILLGHHNEYISLALQQSNKSIQKLRTKLQDILEKYGVSDSSTFKFRLHTSVGYIPCGKEAGGLLKKLQASLAPAKAGAKGKDALYLSVNSLFISQRKGTGHRAPTTAVATFNVAKP